MDGERRLEEHLRKKPYLIDAIAGNSGMLVALGRTGRLYRLWWPHIDYPQHADELRTGVCVAGRDEGIAWFDEPADGWRHEAAYLPRTNAYRVAAWRDGYPVRTEQTDFAVPGRPIFVRGYRLTNVGDEPFGLEFYGCSSFRMMESELYASTEFRRDADALVHFRHRYAFAVGGSISCEAYQAGQNSRAAAEGGRLNGNVIDMQPDGAMKWTFADIGPGRSAAFAIYICAGHSRAEALAALAEARATPYAEWLARMERSWGEFLDSATPCPGGDARIRALYERSLLAMKLLADEATGTIVAAPEFDEHFTRCGGYAYSWGRDAAFVTTAFDRAGLGAISAKFYDWALTAQEPDGSWQQRHYHDGSLAPSWGMQIDEGASLLWGMGEHYRMAGEPQAFLERMWPAVERGAAFLIRFLDPDTGLPRASRDLWEEREGTHTYSAAAVSGGLRAAARFARVRGETALSEAWDRSADTIAAAIAERCWNERDGAYYRTLDLVVSREHYDWAVSQGETGRVRPRDKGYVTCTLDTDRTIDVSLLGVSVPFGVVRVDDPDMARTADTIEARLTSVPTGGIRRYENDSYIGGNPWILTTLWLCQYRTLQGRYGEARRLLDFAVRHATEAGLLPEQVNGETGETAWVVPLTWSHAMFVLAIHALSERGQLPGAQQ